MQVAEARKNLNLAREDVEKHQGKVVEMELLEADEKGRLNVIHKKLRKLEDTVQEKDKDLSAARKLRDNHQNDDKLTRRKVQVSSNRQFSAKKLNQKTDFLT